MVVAEEGGFTKAAVKLGVSQSALSHALKGLENRVGAKLLERTTRKVGLTSIGKKLFDDIHSRFNDINNSLKTIDSDDNILSGVIRIGATEITAHKFLWPVLSDFIKDYPHVTVEVDIIKSKNQEFSNFDAVIEIGEYVYKDRKTIQLSNINEVVTVASPLYLERYGVPEVPTDLNKHKIIGVIVPFQNKKQSWKFTRNEVEMIVQNDLSLAFNTYSQAVLAMKGHAGIAHLPKMLIQDDVESSNVSLVLSDWSSTMPGFYIHYPINQPDNPILISLVAALKKYATSKYN